MLSPALVPATDKPSRDPRDHPNRDPSDVELHPVTRLVSAGKPSAAGNFAVGADILRLLTRCRRKKKAPRIAGPESGSGVSGTGRGRGPDNRRSNAGCTLNEAIVVPTAHERSEE
jgi:hypothetical protein